MRSSPMTTVKRALFYGPLVLIGILCVVEGVNAKGPLSSGFLSGMNLGNVDWFPFQGNLYDHTAEELKEMLKGAIVDISEHGGNAIRLWLHNDLSRNPTFTPYVNESHPGTVIGLQPEVAEDLKWVLSICKQHRVKVLLSMISHDILAVRRWNPPQNRARVIKMITDPASTQAYIDKVVIPLVRALKGAMGPGSSERYADQIIGYEILNEPEGLSSQLRLYHNYMYTLMYGTYSYKNPDLYDSEPSRADDYRSLAFLRQTVEATHPDPTDSTKLLFTGPVFLAGPSPGQPRPPCVPITEDSITRVTAQGGTAITPLPPYFWVSDPMYFDLFAKYNSEFAYLLPMVAQCKLQTQDIDMKALMRFTNKVAAAIHREDPEALVGVGQHSTPYMTDSSTLKTDTIKAFEPNPRNWYSRASLQEAFQGGNGGTYDENGTMDFYAPHAYPFWGNPNVTDEFSPFLHSKSKWEVEEPVILGEFWSKISDTRNLTADDWYKLRENQYAGALGWAYFDVREPPLYNSTLEEMWDLWPLRWLAKHELRDPMLAMIKEVSDRMGNSRPASNAGRRRVLRAGGIDQ